MRPRRIHKTDGGKYYYLIAGKRKYIKVPVGISQKQLTKININILAPEAKRIKRKKKKPKLVYGQKFIKTDMETVPNKYGLPLHIFNPKYIPTVGNDEKERVKGEISGLNTKILDLTKKIDLLNKQQRIQLNVSPIPLEKLDIPTTKKEDISTTKKQDITKRSKTHVPHFEVARIIGQLKNDNKSLTLGNVNAYINEFYNNNSKNFLFNRVSIPKFQNSLKEFQYREKEINESLKKYPLKNTIAEFKNAETDTEVDKLDNKINTGVFTLNDFENEIPLESDEEKNAKLIFVEKKIGGKGIDDGLFNDEIERIVKHRIKGNYIPVIPQDKISSLPRFVKNGAKIFGAVINTNPSASDGSGNDGFRPGHWISVVVDARDDAPSVEYFDPLVQDKPSPELTDALGIIARKLSPEKMAKFKENFIIRQKNNSSSCGVHSAKFLEDRFQGRSWEDATGYSHWEKTHPTVNDAKDGENKIDKIKKVYKKYI